MHTDISAQELKLLPYELLLHYAPLQGEGDKGEEPAKLTLCSYNLLKIIDTIKKTCIKAIENKGTTVKTFLTWLRRTNDY